MLKLLDGVAFHLVLPGRLEPRRLIKDAKGLPRRQAAALRQALERLGMEPHSHPLVGSNHLPRDRHADGAAADRESVAHSSLPSCSRSARKRMQRTAWSRCGRPVSGSFVSPSCQATRWRCAAAKYRRRASGTLRQFSGAYFFAPKVSTSTTGARPRHGIRSQRGFSWSNFLPSSPGLGLVISGCLQGYVLRGVELERAAARREAVPAGEDVGALVSARLGVLLEAPDRLG